MKITIKWLHKIFISFISLFILFSVIAFYLFTTSSGLQSTIYLAKRLLPGELSITKVEGKLSHKVTINNLLYRNQKLSLQIESLYLDWRPYKLIQGKFLIKQLLINHPQIKIFNTEKKDGKPLSFRYNFPFWLPKEININNAEIKHLSFNQTAIPDTKWQILVQRDNQILLLHKLTCYTLDGTLIAKGKVNIAPFLQWQIDLEGRYLQLEKLVKQSPGSISFQLTSIGYKQQLQFFNSLNLKELKGKLYHAPLSAQGKISFAPHQLRIDHLQLSAGKNTAYVTGQFDQYWKAKWQIDFPDISQLLPNSHGYLISTGKITGDFNLPHIQFNVVGSNIYLAPYLFGLEKITGGGILTAAHSQANLALRKIQMQSYTTDSLNIFFAGPLSHHLLQLRIQQAQNVLNLHLLGQYSNAIWKAQINRLDLNSNNLGNWHLHKPTFFTISKTYIELQPLRWTNIRNYLLASGQWQKENTWNINLESTQQNLNFLNLWLPKHTSVSSRLHFKLNAEKTQGQSKFNVLLQIMPGTIIYKSLKLGAQHIHFNGGLLSANLSPTRGLNSRLDFSLTQGQKLNASLLLPNYKKFEQNFINQNIQGEISAHFSDWRFLSALLPKTFSTPYGLLDLQSHFAGTLLRPTLMGSLKFSQGQVEIEPLNTQYKRINFTAQSSHNGLIQYDGSMQSGEGRIELHGETDLNRLGTPSTLNISGHNFSIANTDEYHVEVSPKLTLQTQGNRIELIGEIFIPKAKIMPINFVDQAVVLPRDVVFVDLKHQKSNKSPWHMLSHIRVILGNEIFIDSMGLKGQLAGKIDLHDDTDRLTMGNGELHIKNGAYKIYGQELNINTGRLFFTGGPVTNPSLEIRAVRQIKILNVGGTNTTDIATKFNFDNQLTVGAYITGTLDEPQTSLFSDPATLSQSDILSYLVLGHPSDQVSIGDANMLLQAASSLNLGGNQFEQITREFQNILGLDQLSVESNSYVDPTTSSLKQNTSLVLGKALSPKFYISYSVGLIEPINVFTVRYLINSKWTLQSSSSTFANSADILYTLER